MAEGMLGQIAAAKRTELAGRFGGVSLDALRDTASVTRRSLLAVVERHGARFILEVKKASPSQGAIRPNGDPAALARGYVGVADALSVLTDRPFFGGSLADLKAARAAFDGPILAKDFFLDLRQVAEARIAGADAILVMLSLLDDTEARAMLAEARRFGMDALVEVHDEREMGRALALGAPLIGINNRDLRDLSIDLGTTERLAPLARGRALVSESGIATRQDVERLSHQVDGFLVGTALMRSEDPALAARELIFGVVKLCGLNRAEDFTAARPASHVGLVFVPESPRAISIPQAMRMTGLHDRLVGVFRNAPLADVGQSATLLGLTAVQLHGDEDAAYVRALTRRLPAGCEVWKALSADAFRSDFDAADRLVFDTGAGGTGRSFDWTLIANHPRLSQSLIAGGIGRHNAEAAQRLGAYAIDVGSKLDVSPGRKCADKIAALFEALRRPSRQEMRLCA